MSEQISPEMVKHVAKLARLHVEDVQISTFSQQLSSILEYVEKIGEVDTDGVEPMAHILPLQNVLREDTAVPCLSLQQVLQNAPDHDGTFFKVPKIIGGDEDSAG